MLHSHKEHLQIGRIKVRDRDGLIYFKATFTGKASSFCKRADSYLNDFNDFHKYVIDGNANLCKTCMKKYKELKQEVIELRK